MIVYQISIKGTSGCFDAPFTCKSKNVYTSIPSKNDIEEFINKCCDTSYFDFLDSSHPYETKILELDLIDNGDLIKEVNSENTK